MADWDDFDFDFGEPPAGPQMGAAAFGSDPEGQPTGAEAIGGSDTQHPLRGALLFGNDPDGNPRGSDAMGGSDMRTPLKGALLFGNDPEGGPRGSEAVGGSERSIPLKGALLFGNDPEGGPRGSDAVGGTDASVRFRGSEAFGAPQFLPKTLSQDPVGYDFGGVLLRIDETTMAGIRKDARDRLRQRVLTILERRLTCERDRLRHGLGEHAIPWGRLKRDPDLDRSLAEELRDWYRRAPGEVVGIDQVREVLEGSQRMHTFTLSCDWDSSPVALTVNWRDVVVARVSTKHHRMHTYFEIVSDEGEALGYVDTISPREREQTARVRDARGRSMATFELVVPGVRDETDGKDPTRFEGIARDARERTFFRLIEKIANDRRFEGELCAADEDVCVGRVTDELSKGKVASTIELDLRVPRLVVWAVGILMADLARLRRRGWPDQAIEPETRHVEAPIPPFDPDASDDDAS